MMDCGRYRRLLLADPQDRSPELFAHRESCSVCRAYTERLLRFESRLATALRVDLPLPAHRAAPRTVAYRKSWLAMAASVVMAVVVAGGLWLASPPASLAADVVAHMAGEPDAWRRSEVSVADSALLAVLRDSKMRLAPNAGLVSYASSCVFRGHRVAHLVLQTDSGPVTVMVLVRERVSKPVQFDEQGYRGVIVPVAGHGSLAVLARDTNADPKAVERFAARILQYIEWTG